MVINEGQRVFVSEAQVGSPEMADEHDSRLLPIANVGRIMKQILPASAKISKEAKETMQECATEFISFVTGEASGKCHKENRKTVNGDDICWALSSLGFDDYAESMLRYLHKLREYENQRAKQSKLASNDDEEEEEEEDAGEASKGKQPETPFSFEFRVLHKGESSVQTKGKP